MMTTNEPVRKAKRVLALKFQIRVPSFDQQAVLLKKALLPFYDEIVIPKTSMYGQCFTTWFVFTPALGSYLFQLAMGGSMIHAQHVMYVTAEGVPNVSSAQQNLLNSKTMGWTVLAVSEFSKDMLTNVGINVAGVVPHAIDEDEPQRCQTQAEQLRAHYEQLYPGRVLFAYTGSTVARKKADLMISAFREAEEKSGHKIALISNSALKPLLKPTDTWCLEENIFGRAPHEYITALHSACDWFLWSTLCEGFGVPPLEAMSCGKPVVAGKFAPSTEFMNDYTTLWFDCPNVRKENYGLEQDFVMHYYDKQALVDAILKAVDIFVNYKDTYNSMCSAAVDQASKYDYRKMYGLELRKYLV
jgi:glycosyltransferase involved in cell wall biosynthesis